MVVDMRLVSVVCFLVFARIVVAVDDLVMVVLVCMPVGTLLEVIALTACVVVGHMPVVVHVCHGRMGVLWLFAFTLCTLRCLIRHQDTPLHERRRYFRWRSRRRASMARAMIRA
jgi:hypothetical protein